MTLNFLLLMPITYLAFRQTPDLDAGMVTLSLFLGMTMHLHAFDGIKIFVASPGAELVHQT